jgi:hypothetical protein
VPATLLPICYQTILGAAKENYVGLTYPFPCTAPKRGLEPPRAWLAHKDLNLARLPQLDRLTSSHLAPIRRAGRNREAPSGPGCGPSGGPSR